MNGETHTFGGEVKGNITGDKSGKNGFGYDPVFIPEGYEKTFGELSPEIKNSISHRANALAKLSDWLSENE
jgi:XTP/dITP diphosphohydrolase